MTRGRRNPPVEEVNIFTCLLCEDGVDIPAAEYKRHREEVHGLTEHKGRRRATMHMDARDFFIWAFEWRSLDDDKLFAVQTTKTPRRPRDRAPWDDGEDEEPQLPLADSPPGKNP